MPVCTPSDCPPVTPERMAELHAKYLAERDRRIKQDHNDQYIPTSGKWAKIYEEDPYTPVAPREPITGETDVVILGAGYCGMMVATQLKKAGIDDFYTIDHGGNFGGTWYWNRYPGIQCDNDAYCYLPLLEETGWLPSKKFSDGKEIYDYIQLIADQFEMRDKALFHTLITSLKWDEGIQRWQVTTNRGDEIRARFVIMAGGTLSTPKFPSVRGLHSFKGKMFHTSRWDFEYTGGSWGDPVLTGLKGKKVAILGTGATSIQAVPYLGKYAEHLYVLQRTPSSVDERPNPPTDPDWAASLTPGWQAERQDNFLRAANEIIPPGEPDLICDIWTEINRNINGELESEGWPQIAMDEFFARREAMDFRVMERLRQRVDSIVKDPETAEKLKPYYNFMCKRPLSNNDYYDTFNRPNVTLIDVSHTQGLEEMTEKGFVVDGVEYEVDCMIFASGFEVTGDLKRRWGIETVEGRGGLSIYDKWADGPHTFQGAMTHGFPNMFFSGYIQNGLNGTTTLMFGSQVHHASQIIRQTLDKNMVVAEPTQAAEDAYVARFREVAIDLTQHLEQCTPSYFTNEGDKEPKWFLFRGWGLGWGDWTRMLEHWRSSGELEGLQLEAPKVEAA